MNTIQGPKIASSIFIGRWTPRILFSLRERPYRHGQLRRRLGRASQRMMTRTLRNLESAGLIARRVTQSKDHFCRVFTDHPGKDNHRSTQRNVSLGETLQQGNHCSRAPSGCTNITIKKLAHVSAVLTSKAQ